MRELRASDALELLDAAKTILRTIRVHGHPEDVEQQAGAINRLRASTKRAEENAGYNGWTNYETWAVALWIDNEQGTYLYARELLEDKALDTGDAAEALKGWIVNEMAPDLGASMFADLLGAALSSVNWQEIAKHMKSE